ncbi:hypothetical protein HMPREF0239_01300 [Clostridium sp. ATCC BAA-442]|nr:hypothetical protein HMPREF0239_01300 [Clostridium sp. ATCC BAA-442]
MLRHYSRHFARDASTEIYQKLNIIQESIIHPFSIKRRLNYEQRHFRKAYSTN